MICEQSCDFTHLAFAWALCWWEAIKWVQTPSREYLWASQPQPKILLSETSFLLRGHCSSLGLHPDKMRILSVKNTESRHHMRHMTCEWLDWVMSLQDIIINSKIIHGFDMCTPDLCLKLSWASKWQGGNGYFMDCQLFGSPRWVFVKTDSANRDVPEAYRNVDKYKKKSKIKSNTIFLMGIFKMTTQLWDCKANMMLLSLLFIKLNHIFLDI